MIRGHLVRGEQGEREVPHDRPGHGGEQESPQRRAFGRGPVDYDHRRAGPCCHASAAIMRKLHTDYGRETIMCRALLHSGRAFLPDKVMTGVERKIARVERQLEALDRRQPQRIRGRQLLLPQ